MKTLPILALTVSVVTAAPYAGLSLGFSSMKDNAKFTGIDSNTPDTVVFSLKNPDISWVLNKHLV